MTGRHVSFTLTARDQINQEHQWWLEHRDQRQLFELEVGAALVLVALLPGIGTPYELSPVPDVRRLYLDKIDATCTTRTMTSESSFDLFGAPGAAAGRPLVPEISSEF